MTEKKSVWGEKTTFKILSLFIKTKFPAVFEIIKATIVALQRWTIRIGDINSFKMGLNRHVLTNCHTGT